MIGVALLALRYRRTDGAQRRQIRWLLFGIAASLSLWIPAGALWQLADPDSTAASVAAELLSGLAEVTTLGSVLGALFYTGVFGIDEPARRASRAPCPAGVDRRRARPPGGPGRRADQPGRAGRRRGGGRRGRGGSGPDRSAPSGGTLADRWVLGARLAGYASLSRFGESLTRVPGSAELLRDLAGEIRRGLDLTWTRVSLEPPGGQADAAPDGPVVSPVVDGPVVDGTVADGTAAGEPAAIVPIEHRGTALGRIECGPRTDGPLLAEDRRLLAYFAAQAAVGVQQPVPRRRAGRLPGPDRGRPGRRAAPDPGGPARRGPAGDRGAVGQGRAGAPAAAAGRAGRGRRAGRDCSATWPRPCRTSGRSPTRSIRRCCPTAACSRRSRLSPAGSRCRWRSAPTRGCAACGSRAQIEATAWYVLAEALSNVVKHAKASEVEVSLRAAGRHARPGDPRRRLRFRPGPAARGLGLTGLSDRLDTVGGSVTHRAAKPDSARRCACRSRSGPERTGA